MQKYRKRRPEAEIVEPIFGMGYDCGRDVEKAAFVNRSGRLEEWYREDFDREHERVEEDTVEATVKAGWGEVFDALNSGKEKKRGDKKAERPKCCSACGKSLDPGTSFRETDGSTEYFCYDCWQVRKKPTPLTLADLKPGDVFRYSFAPVYPNAMRQILNNEYYFSPEMHGGALDSTLINSDWRARPVERIAHYPITPKQQSWIDATNEERKALEDSIRDKWLPIMRGEKKGRGANDCPLCRLSTGAMFPCEHYCVLARASGHCGALGYCEEAQNVRDPGSYRLARRFTSNMAEFLPNIHPTRIEVEATPVEWPGGK